MRIISLFIFVGSIFLNGSLTVASDSCRAVYVFVALADNEHQGIIPVPAKIGNGNDPDNNLYWGAAFGVKTFLKRSNNWKLISDTKNVRQDTVLEQCIFKHVNLPLNVIAYAYKGERIKEAVSDFLACAAGRANLNKNQTHQKSDSIKNEYPDPSLVVYVGHEGLMDFNLPIDSLKNDSTGKNVIILACMSRQFFWKHLKALKAEPILWTTGLMAPEAYTLEAAIIPWAEGKSLDEIRTNAARAYDRYQKCGLRAAKNLLVSGF